MKVRKFVLFYAHLHGLYSLQHNIDCMMLNYNLKYEIINSLSLWFFVWMHFACCQESPISTIKYYCSKRYIAHN